MPATGSSGKLSEVWGISPLLAGTAALLSAAPAGLAVPLAAAAVPPALPAAVLLLLPAFVLLPVLLPVLPPGVVPVLPVPGVTTGPEAGLAFQPMAKGEKEPTCTLSLSQKGYTFRFNRKYPTLKPPGKPRPIRFKTLGKQYTPEAIQQRILYSQKTYPAEPHVRHVRLHGTYQKVRKLKGLRVFYYRELYMLGVFHRKPWHPSPAVREEIRQLDKRIEQYEFLMNRDTRTLAQLRDLRAQTEAEVRKLNAERNRLYKTNPESDQIPLFTQRLRELRKTIKLCKRIEEHSLEIAQRQEEEQKRRAEQERRNAYERNTMETSAPIRP